MKNNYAIEKMYELSKERLASFQEREVTSLSPKELREYATEIARFKLIERRYKQSLNHQEEYKQEATANSRLIRRDARLVTGVASLGLAAMGLSGCANPNIPTSEESAEPTQIEMVAENKEVDVSEINAIINDVTKFINDGISKGLVYYDLDESDKNIVAKVALDYYLMANQNSLSQKTFNILNQDGELNAEYMLGNTFNFETVLQEYLPGAGLDNKLNYDQLYINENDAEIVNDIATIVHKMHDAIEANDRATYDGLIKDAIAFKNSMIGENSKHGMLNDPIALDQALQYLDIADSLANGTVIGDTEADILNQSIEKCLNGEFVSTMEKETLEVIANKLNVQITSDMSKEELIQAIHNSLATSQDVMSLRSVFRTMAESAMEARIDTSLKFVNKYNGNGYDYLSVVNDIANGIDLTKQVLPEYDPYEFENKNQWGPNAYKDGGLVYGSGGTKVTTSTSTKTSTSTRIVDASEVPSSQKVNDIESATKADGTPTTKENLEDTKKKLEQKQDNGKSAIDNASEQGATGDILTTVTDNEDANAVIKDTYDKNKDYYNQHKDDYKEETVDVPDGVEEQVGDIEYVYTQASETIDSYTEEGNSQVIENEIFNEIFPEEDFEEIDMTMGGITK